jgi:hypothetical protein
VLFAFESNSSTFINYIALEKEADEYKTIWVCDKELQSLAMLNKLIIVVALVQFIRCASVNRCLEHKKIDKRELITSNVTISDELFQGDIVLTVEQQNMMRHGAVLRTGAKDVASRWPKNTNGLGLQ